ncbi:hypothetical protein P606_13505 [Comamonas thiooxydans]|nr:hypothetical protein P606_13505 [Comamonas thiooxydans]
MTELKVQVVNSCKEITADWRSGVMGKNGILLYGDPGNGKTAFGRAIAGSYNLPFFEIKAANITSQWIGETARAIKESFDFVKRNAPCVLMLDEIDSLIGELDKNSNKDQRDIRNTMLTELVDIRSFDVFVIGATNYFDKLSAAAVREGRFDFKIEVRCPDKEARAAILRQALCCDVDEVLLDIVSKRYAGFSVKRLMSIAREAGNYAGSGPLEIAHFSAALRKLQGSKGNALRDVPSLNELCFNEDLRAEVDDLAMELTAVDQLLMQRSTPFKGALFVGPAGTGKTAVAKAIAKETNWAFLDIAAPDIIADFDKLEEIYRKAKDLRPCVVFIDEATDLIKDRTISNYASHTNKLLTIIDGFGEPIPDVVFMAATNHGEDVDEAVARRLYRRIDFDLPNNATRKTLIRRWAGNNQKAMGAITHSIERLVHRTEAMSAANIINWLDTEYKRAVLAGIRTQKEPDFNSVFK